MISLSSLHSVKMCMACGVSLSLSLCIRASVPCSLSLSRSRLIKITHVSKGRKTLSRTNDAIAIEAATLSGGSCVHVYVHKEKCRQQLTLVAAVCYSITMTKSEKREREEEKAQVGSC